MTIAEEFAAFWACYPRRIGKLVALKSYGRARRLASAADILVGVERYRRHLPSDSRFVPHAATWLNQGRWDDEYDEVVPMVSERTAALARASAAFLGTEVKRLD